jgi:hypothetical protein
METETVCPAVPRRGPEAGNPHKNRSFFLPKTELTRIEKPPNPGVLRALISVTRQNGLRLGENEALFDRKLLEELHEQGVTLTSDRADLRAIVRIRK